MRNSLLVVVLLAVAGCAMKTPEQLARDTAYCRELGYAAGSEAMRTCVDRQDERRWVNRRVREQKDCSPECERWKAAVGSASPLLGLALDVMTRSCEPED
jgi:hypothetical protein